MNMVKKPFYPEHFITEYYEKVWRFWLGRRNHLILLILLSFAIIILVSLKWNIDSYFEIDKDTLYWTFSTIAQSLFALIGFCGIVIIFFFQVMSAERDRLFDIMCSKDSIFMVLGGKYPQSIEDFEQQIKQMVREGQQNPQLKKVSEFFDVARYLRVELIKSTKEFILYTFAVIFTMFLFIGLTPAISTHGAGTFILVLSSTIVGYAMFLITKILREIFMRIQYSFW